MTKLDDAAETTAAGAAVNPPDNAFTRRIQHVITDLGKNGIFLALLVVVVLFEFLTGGILLRPQNVSNLIVQNGYILILAIGMVMVIVAGHIDLSVGSIAAFVGAISGVFAVNLGVPWWLLLAAPFLAAAVWWLRSLRPSGGRHVRSRPEPPG